MHGFPLSCGFQGSALRSSFPKAAQHIKVFCAAFFQKSACLCLALLFAWLHEILHIPRRSGLPCSRQGRARAFLTVHVIDMRARLASTWAVDQAELSTRPPPGAMRTCRMRTRDAL